MLGAELDEILDIDMSAFGFEDIDLEGFFEEVPEQSGENTSDDAAYKLTVILSSEEDLKNLKAYCDENGFSYEE